MIGDDQTFRDHIRAVNLEAEEKIERKRRGGRLLREMPVDAPLKDVEPAREVGERVDA